MKDGMKGVLIATAAASLFSTAFAYDAPSAKKKTEEEKIHCSGINSCKGTGACASATNACKGSNSCKGKGWVSVTAQECTDKGGKVVKDEKDKDKKEDKKEKKSA